MRDCPPDGALAKFLGDELSESDAAALDRHLAGCAVCQKRVHALSAAAEEEALRPEPTDPACEPPADVLTRLTRIATSALADTRPNHPVPVEFPGYEIVGEIGRGGMGVVYKARQLALGRVVALKVLLGGAQAPAEDRERFRREATTAAGLDHPDIVRVYEVGDHGGVVYFAMELVEGGSLDRRLDGTPWAAPAAAKLVETVARAVQHAHERGIVHRDLKPANILLAGRPGALPSTEAPPSEAAFRVPDFAPKVTDFGLARVLESNDARTRTGMLLGTPSYMAPEQVSGSAGATGPPADVYALGVVLYELLTGRPPFAEPDVVETLVQVRFHDPVPPRRLRPTLPRDLDTVVLKCLRKEPARRYPTADALADDLRRFLDGRPVLARPTRAWERAAKAARRHPWIAGLSAACVALFVVGFVLILAQWRRAEDEAGAARAATTREQEAKRDAVRLSATAVLDLGISLCERGDTEQGLIELGRAEQLAAQAEDADLQRAARANLGAWRREWFPVAAELRHPSRLLAAAYSPDGRRLATAGADGSARLWDADTGRLVVELVHDRPVRAVAFAPDGRALYTGAGADDGTAGEVRVWNAGDGRPLRDPIGFASAVRSLDVSSDSRRFLVVTPGDVWVCGSDEQPKPFASMPRRESDARFAGEHVVVLGGRRLVVHSPGGGRLMDFTHNSAVAARAFDPSGRFIATADGERVVRVWDASAGRAVTELAPLPGAVRAVALSTDGAALATCSDISILNPEAEARLRRDVPVELRVWDAATGRPLLAPLRLPRRATAIAFSPCGRLLLAGGDDGAARLFRLADGVAVGKPVAHPGRVEVVAFRPDGKGFLMAGGSTRSADARRESVIECRTVPEGAAESGVVIPHSEIVYRIAFSPGGESVWVGTWGKPPRGHDVRTGAALGGDAPAVPDPAWFGPPPAPAPRLPALRFWDQAIGQQLAPGQQIAAGRGVVYAPNGRHAAVVTRDRTVLWDVVGWRQTGEPLTPAGGCTTVAFRPDGTAVLVIGVDRSAVLCDAATGTRLGSWTFPAAVWSAAFHPAGELIAVAGPGASVRLWHVERGEPIGPPMSHREAGVMQVAFHPDGRLLATGGRDGTVRLWDVGTGRPVGAPLTFSDRVTAVAFDPTGATLAVGVENRRVELRALRLAP